MRRAACQGCKAEIIVKEGGGFFFHQLRCVRCGRATQIGRDEIADLHLRYLKGSELPYTVGQSAEHQYVREQVDVEPLSSEEYYAAIEAVRKCDCGGRLSFDAPPRCPRCGSLEIKLGDVVGNYD